jgi:hypothetical protein
MNAVTVNPKQVEAVPARMVQVNAVSWRTTDDAFARRLQIIVNGTIPIVVQGDDYDALGQWTDETVKQLVLTRLGLVEVV